ncbi:MAG: hypothetical protein CL823_00555 [Crocinitomicaceae bacterium]|nr:hypothetical protein [Crocinitomicaceae bacterium]|tara:strand:- start:3334 stop:3759 length:426 start_codon:yes stop_codon:yes gene_type:complete
MVTKQTIEEIIEDKNIHAIYGDVLGDIAGDLAQGIYQSRNSDAFKGGIVVFEISREDLINNRGFNTGESWKEIGHVKYGDWEGLKKIIGEEETILEKQESEIYIKELLTDSGYEQESYEIGRSLLYCEGHFIYSGVGNTAD